MLVNQIVKECWLKQSFIFMFICLSVLISNDASAVTSNMAVKTLNAKYMALSNQLTSNQFQRELHLNSEETSHNLKGEIYAVVDYPFSTVNTALNNSEHWCDVLILHVNVKYCHATINEQGPILSVNIGTKDEQALADTYRVNFNYHEINSSADYFRIDLDAKDGPLSTQDYHIQIEATPLKDGKTFVHFSYAYAFGLTGRLAMQTYLATIARNKVGFTVTGQQADGQNTYIKGIRGLVERNTMRYYLAIDAYLSALGAPADAQLLQRLKQWHKSTNQYPRQLHEVELNDYLDMKLNEYQRQQILR